MKRMEGGGRGRVDSRGSSGGEELWGQGPSPLVCEDGPGHFNVKPGAGREAAGGKNWKALRPRRQRVQRLRGRVVGYRGIDSDLPPPPPEWRPGFSQWQIPAVSGPGAWQWGVVVGWVAGH